jgi:hypothetical protein
MVSCINLTLPTIYVHVCIPSPFLTKYFELFNVLGHPVVKTKGNDLPYVPNSPAADAAAVNPVEVEQMNYH